MGGASPNVVAPALQRWRQTFAAQLDANAGSALEVLPPGVLELLQALWSRALFEAHRVRADAPSAVQALDRLNMAIADLRDQTARLQAREDQVDAQLRDLDRQRHRLAEAESALARRLSAMPRPRTPPERRRRTVTTGAALPKRGPSKKKAGKPGPKRRPKPAAARRGTARRNRRT
jgi:FtsZ-binding cell division protein ZapB